MIHIPQPQPMPQELSCIILFIFNFTPNHIILLTMISGIFYIWLEKQ
jgi:hypothetical protein